MRSIMRCEIMIDIDTVLGLSACSLVPHLSRQTLWSLSSCGSLIQGNNTHIWVTNVITAMLCISTYFRHFLGTHFRHAGDSRTTNKIIINDIICWMFYKSNLSFWLPSKYPASGKQIINSERYFITCLQFASFAQICTAML